MLVLFEEGFHNGVSSAVGSTDALCVTWAFEPEPTPPAITNRSLRRTIVSNMPFWRAFNGWVTPNGPTPPVRLLRHGLQAAYSRTKCGVDGTVQCRAGLRSPSSRIDWDSKVVTQTLKTLVVNSFISWCFHPSRCGGGDVGSSFADWTISGKI